MLRPAVISTVLLITVSTTTTQAPSNPSFCRDLDCPRYTVINTFKGYELRRYEPSQWVGTRDVTRTNQRNPKMFWKLFSYISGNNTEGLKIPMTVPVLNIHTRGVGINNQETVLEMLFMIPHSKQPYPPYPADPTVYITRLPAFNVYVKSYSGYSNPRRKLARVAELKKEINDTNLYYSDHFYSAGYDSPWQTNNRHNEVWLAARQ
ncbi:heme-binding protein 2-like [Saccostrea echinata]|uniref:heme-binding protein 2-like n=1 Tax=Saccostrea echinata TaxID=191078 RepID=UPI002A829BAB|nr:heme-binding protein 2-like [Saccostrea echinata]